MKVNKNHILTLSLLFYIGFCQAQYLMENPGILYFTRNPLYKENFILGENHRFTITIPPTSAMQKIASLLPNSSFVNNIDESFTLINTNQNNKEINLGLSSKGEYQINAGHIIPFKKYDKGFLKMKGNWQQNLNTLDANRDKISDIPLTQLGLGILSFEREIFSKKKLWDPKIFADFIGLHNQLELEKIEKNEWFKSPPFKKILFDSSGINQETKFYSIKPGVGFRITDEQAFSVFVEKSEYLNAFHSQKSKYLFSLNQLNYNIIHRLRLKGYSSLSQYLKYNNAQWDEKKGNYSQELNENRYEYKVDYQTKFNNKFDIQAILNPWYSSYLKNLKVEGCVRLNAKIWNKIRGGLLAQHRIRNVYALQENSNLLGRGSEIISISGLPQEELNRFSFIVEKKFGNRSNLIISTSNAYFQNYYLIVFDISNNQFSFQELKNKITLFNIELETIHFLLNNRLKIIGSYRYNQFSFKNMTSLPLYYIPKHEVLLEFLYKLNRLLYDSPYQKKYDINIISKTYITSKRPIPNSISEGPFFANSQVFSNLECTYSRKINSKEKETKIIQYRFGVANIFNAIQPNIYGTTNSLNNQQGYDWYGASSGIKLTAGVGVVF